VVTAIKREVNVFQGRDIPKYNHFIVGQIWAYEIFIPVVQFTIFRVMLNAHTVK